MDINALAETKQIIQSTEVSGKLTNVKFCFGIEFTYFYRG